MSTWTSKRLFAATLALLALGGCVTGLEGGGGPLPLRVTVAGGAITVAGPQGYCIDTSASRQDAAGSFVLLAACDSVSGRAGAPRPATPVILTASVSEDLAAVPVAQSHQALATFFGSEAGRAALSRSGRAASVRILETASVGRAFYVRAEDTGGGEGRAVEPAYWRAIFDLKGRIVTASALGPSDAPVSSAAKRAVLDAFVARLRALNGG